MKITKRLLSIALALVLGLGLLVPAFAAAEIDPNAPIILRQPNEAAFLFIGDTLRLTVEARLPQGSEGTLSFAWYYYEPEFDEEPKAIGAGQNLTLAITHDFFYGDATPEERAMYAGKIYHFYVVVTNDFTDEDGQLQSVPVQSESAEVVCAGSHWRMVFEYLELYGRRIRHSPRRLCGADEYPVFAYGFAQYALPAFPGLADWLAYI